MRRSATRCALLLLVGLTPLWLGGSATAACSTAPSASGDTVVVTPPPLPLSLLPTLRLGSSDADRRGVGVSSAHAITSDVSQTVPAPLPSIVVRSTAATSSATARIGGAGDQAVGAARIERFVLSAPATLLDPDGTTIEATTIRTSATAIPGSASSQGLIASLRIDDDVMVGVGAGLTIPIPGVGVLYVNGEEVDTTPGRQGRTRSALRLVLEDGGEIAVARSRASIGSCGT